MRPLGPPPDHAYTPIPLSRFPKAPRSSISSPQLPNRWRVTRVARARCGVLRLPIVRGGGEYTNTDCGVPVLHPRVCSGRSAKRMHRAPHRPSCPWRPSPINVERESRRDPATGSRVAGAGTWRGGTHSSLNTAGTARGNTTGRLRLLTLPRLRVDSDVAR